MSLGLTLAVLVCSGCGKEEGSPATSPTGGASTGGASTDEASTGGASTGGASTGGASTSANGGADAGLGGAGGVATPGDLCDAWYDRIFACGWNEGATRAELEPEIEECKAEFEQFAPKWRSELSSALTACAASMPCDGDPFMPDVCFTATVPPLVGSAVDAQTVALCAPPVDGCLDHLLAGAYTGEGVARDCLDRLVACELADDWLTGADHCISLAVLTPAAQQEAAACLSLPCADAGDCLYEAGSIGWDAPLP